MKERLCQYIDLLFAGSQDSDDIKQEILQNTLDRYDDLITQGKTPEAAYSLAISGIGDISELLNNTHTIPSKPTEDATQNHTIVHKGSGIYKAIAIAFFILCPVPLLILENVIGLCLLLVMVAAGVGLLVISGKENSAVTTQENPRSAANRTINGILWGCGLAIYFLVSFHTGAWYITWLIFPILGSGCGIVDACFDLNKVFVSAVIRIILLGIITSLLILVLLGSCLGIVVSDYISIDSSVVGGNIASAGSVSAKEIRSIDIHWVSGSIIIQEGDVSDIEFSESSGLSEEHRMIWKKAGDKLIIEFCKPSLFQISVPSKDLVVTVPKGWIANELNLDSVSAKIKMNELTIHAADILNVSGECGITDCSITDFSAETVSGKVNFAGSAETFELSTVSADCTASLSGRPKSMDLEAVSGDLILYLPDLQGFTATLDTVSGKFTSEIPTTASGNTYLYGDGSCKISVDSVSGDILIKTIP